MVFFKIHVINRAFLSLSAGISSYWKKLTRWMRSCCRGNKICAGGPPALGGWNLQKTPMKRKKEIFFQASMKKCSMLIFRGVCGGPHHHFPFFLFIFFFCFQVFSCLFFFLGEGLRGGVTWWKFLKCVYCMPLRICCHVAYRWINSA